MPVALAPNAPPSPLFPALSLLFLLMLHTRPPSSIPCCLKGRALMALGEAFVETPMRVVWLLPQALKAKLALIYGWGGMRGSQV